MTTTVEGFAGQCRIFAGELANKTTYNATRAATQAAAAHVATAYVAAGYGRGITSSNGKRTGIPLRIRTFRTGTGPVGYVGANAGVERLIEYGSYKKPDGYTIQPRKRRNKAERRRAIRVGDGFRASVHHPAQKPHPVFHAAAATSGSKSMAAFATVVTTDMAKVFR